MCLVCMFDISHKGIHLELERYSVTTSVQAFI